MDVLSLLFTPIRPVLKAVEALLFLLINLYDDYCYSPLQKTLSPTVAKIPRSVRIAGCEINIFTANIVSWTRTFLVIPVACCLKYDYCVTAFLLILLHDFLDHLDGIVAKVQKSIYGQVDDPLLGSFMDAFCDKIVNVMALWSILMVTDFSRMSWLQTVTIATPCVVIIGYEFVLGVVRVQDYFQAHYISVYGRGSFVTQPNLAAVMEGKLKEKLESMGIAFLCLSQRSANPADTFSGLSGTIFLILSFRLAHASLEHKLKARRKQPQGAGDCLQKDNTEQPTTIKANVNDSDSSALQISIGTQADIPEVVSNNDILSDNDSTEESSDDEQNEIEDQEEEEGDDEVKKEKDKGRRIMRSLSVPTFKTAKVDRVYTIGCFDLFHEGHVILMQRLRSMGKKVIVGVHDSRSIYKLKKRVPIHGTTKRMANVKKHADVVFCVHGTDPTPYLMCAFDKSDCSRSLYVRGDDMPDFPARHLTERLMPIKFLPYTKSVSSTKIRTEVYSTSQFGPHARDDDFVMFY